MNDAIATEYAKQPSLRRPDPKLDLQAIINLEYLSGKHFVCENVTAHRASEMNGREV